MQVILKELYMQFVDTGKTKHIVDCRSANYHATLCGVRYDSAHRCADDALPVEAVCSRCVRNVRGYIASIAEVAE